WVTVRPPCPIACGLRSPRICGRTWSGMCRRFSNICELITLNLQNRGSSSPRWIHTPETDCRRVPGMGAANEFWCQRECTIRPVVCKRSSPHGEICARSLDGRLCKLVANQCQLRNKNCHTQPRNNWLPTDRRRCAGMQLTDNDMPCVSLPTQVTIRPVLPPTPGRA
ncbi:uncharacterized protein LOC6564896, partial [Drosophila grimshawi]